MALDQNKAQATSTASQRLAALLIPYTKNISEDTREDMFASITSSPKDYGVVVDHDKKTITIKETFYTPVGDNESNQSAIKAVKFWNDKSGSYIYRVGEGKEAVDYTVNFDLKVKEVLNPQAELNKDRQSFIPDSKKLTPDQTSNSYQVVRDRDFEKKHPTKYQTDQEGNDSEVKINGITTSGAIIEVRHSERKTDTGPHEVGHSLGLDHHPSGLLTPASNDAARSDTIDQQYVDDMIKNSFEKLNEKVGKGHLMENGTASEAVQQKFKTGEVILMK